MKHTRPRQLKTIADYHNSTWEINTPQKSQVTGW